MSGTAAYHGDIPGYHRTSARTLSTNWLVELGYALIRHRAQRPVPRARGPVSRHVGEQRSGQEAGQDRRQALVRAAFQKIAERGFEGLRLREVAAEAGIDHSTIHHYFPAKQNLITAVVDYATRQFWTTGQPEGGPGDLLRFQLARLSAMITERADLHVVARELDLRARRDPEVQAIVASREEGWRASLTSLLRQCADEGAVAPGVDPASAAELVIATVKGASLAPEHAASALAQLERLLIPAPASAGHGSPDAAGEAS